MTATDTPGPTRPPGSAQQQGASRKRAPAPPRGPVVRALLRARLQLTRVVVLLLLLAVSGLALGLVVSFPVSRLQFNSTGAVRLDQANLAGKLDSEAALVRAEDLSAEWVPGDEALGAFGILGSTFCGTEVPLPTALSDDRSVVFQNPATGSVLIGQALRVDKWQAARDYVTQADRALKDCDEFYARTFSGPVRSRIEDPPGSPAITDAVGATYRSLEEPPGVTEWAILAVGDILVAISVSGPEETPDRFLDTVENRVLTRLVPEEFAPSSSSSTTTSVPPGD